MKLLLLLVVVMSLKSANGCGTSTQEINCALGFSKNCDRDLAYENLRHYNEDLGEYGITKQT